MNGTIYDEIKKNGDSRKKEKLKFMVTIASTNILVAVLCLSFTPRDSQLLISKILPKTLHPHYKMIVVPLTVLCDINPASLETPVTLLSKSKKILITKAFLHEMVPLTTKDLEGLPHFKIEIPEEEVLIVSADSSETMIAIPELKLPKNVKKAMNKRVSQYEINL